MFVFGGSKEKESSSRQPEYYVLESEKEQPDDGSGQ